MLNKHLVQIALKKYSGLYSVFVIVRKFSQKMILKCVFLNIVAFLSAAAENLPAFL